jgi:hypothetical protein
MPIILKIHIYNKKRYFAFTFLMAANGDFSSACICATIKRSAIVNRHTHDATNNSK